MVNNVAGYLYGIPVIIAEHTMKVRNKKHKNKLIDRLYEKIFGWSVISQSSLPKSADVMWSEAASGACKVIYVRNEEVFSKLRHEMYKNALKTLSKETVNL